MRATRRWAASLLCASTLLVPCAVAQPVAADALAPGCAQELIVVTVWPAPKPVALTEAYEQELGALLESLGVCYRFTELEIATRQSFAGKIVLLRMLERGTALETRASLKNLPRSALAWTHASKTDVTPFGAVDLGALRAFLGMDEPCRETPEALRAQGNAIARVAAHEIFHMLTRSKTHSHEGIMKPGLTRNDLLAAHPPGWTHANRAYARQLLSPSRSGVLAAVSAEQSKATGNK